jgi:hypothetical protein
MAPVVTKTTCELYKLRGLPHNGWADITIDAAEEHGRIQIASDWGNWSFFWSHCGGPFKDFLPGLDIGYVAGKFGANKWFDHEKSLRELKRDLLLGRRGEQGNPLSKEKARELWEEVDRLQDEGNETAFGMRLYNNDDLFSRYDGCDFPIYYGIDPGFRNFWRDCWPVFLEYLKNERPPDPCGKPCATQREYEIGRGILDVGHPGSCYHVGG